MTGKGLNKSKCKGIFPLLVIVLIFYAHDSLATRLIDLSRSLADIKNSSCISASDIEKYGIAASENGFQANFHSEKQFVDLLGRIYNCANGYKVGYFLYGAWATDERGRQKTIADSIDRNWLKTWKLNSGLYLFDSFEEAIESSLYKKSIDKYGVDNIFIQRIDFENLKEGGLLNHLNQQVD